MPELKVYNMAGETVGAMTLSDKVFAADINGAVLHADVKCYLGNQRQGTQSTLTRTEVSGGGRKPWRQGSTRAPQWTHGGVALGPKPRLYKTKMNKKVKTIAMLSALSSKVADGEMIVVDKIETAEYKTKTMVKMLKALKAGEKVLVVLAGKDEKVLGSFSNIPGVKVAYTNTINVYDILNCDSFIVAKDAAEKIEEVYA